MHISNLELTNKGKSTTLSATVQFVGGQKQIAYFSVPSEFKNFIFADASPFLAALLIPCMKLGENITIDSSVSKKLLNNTNKIMAVFKEWNLNMNYIKVSGINEKDKIKPQSVGCFFSAGVDSFYTYLKNQDRVNKKQLAKINKISYFIIVHGFDIELENSLLFKKTLQNIQTIAKREGIKVIPIKTNIRSLIEPKLVWDFSHGGALGAVALLLRKKLKTIYIAGAVRKDQLFPYGSHPKLDQLWGTETLRIIHDGTEYDRQGKIKNRVAYSPLALRYLRVCNQNRKGIYNCGGCTKCLKTMMELSCYVDLKKVKAFSVPIDLKKVRNMYYDFSLSYQLQGYRLLNELKRLHRHPELQEAIEESLQMSQKFSFIRMITKQLSNFDKKYLNRKIYRFIFTMNSHNDRNLFFKFFAAKGLIR